jgi:FAD:protein FMN transferase
MTAMSTPREASEDFACFGSTCRVHLAGEGPLGPAAEAAAAVKRALLAWHSQFSRFDASSELALLNADGRRTVPVSGLMARLAESAAAVGSVTGGLVDATLLDEVQAVGYAEHFDGASVPLAMALATAPRRRPARPSPHAGWREVTVDRTAGTVTRPPGLKLDSGGIAKGLFGDVLALELADYTSFAIDCGGDIRLGGAAGLDREVEVAGPFDEGVVHRFVLRQGAVATSGIGRRSWLRADGAPGHHLLDPGRAEPAFTGIVQATALAPTGVLAEALSKAALLAGPDAADGWLTRGGVIVYDDGSHRVVEPARTAQRDG